MSIHLSGAFDYSAICKVSQKKGRSSILIGNKLYGEGYFGGGNLM